MIRLDPKVIFELLKAAGDVNVLLWIAAKIIERPYFSTIRLTELRFGIAALSCSRRYFAHSMLYGKRVLPYNWASF